ncbi:MAG TPA: MBL fold metallo-hydrolase [Steroidobacteraceae bacterium]|nr:MBL fold metallo-hydrolase [Steroidobacteraceae bacterium]
MKKTINVGLELSNVSTMSGPATDRRDFLKTALGSAVGITLASMVSSRAAFARSKPDPIVITPITDSIAQVTGAGSNVVILTKPDGVVMIDGGLGDRSGDLLKAIAKFTKASRPQTLFNTHWHWDHTGSNERLGKAGTKIVAHENTKLWLGAEFDVEWENRSYKPRPKAAWPTETFYTNGKMSFGNEDIVYGYLPRAHTDGDIYVHFPSQNVLVAGDLVSVGSYPILDVATGGWIGGMVDATKALVDLSDDKTRIVPGTGPVQSKADLQAQLQMLTTMKDRLVTLLKKGVGTDDLLAEPPTGEFDAKWGDPKLFLTNAYRGIYGHVRELGGIV